MRSIGAALSLGAALAGPGAAQRQPTLRIDLPTPDSLSLVGPTVRVSHVLEDQPVRELLGHGFPARLHFRVELWRNGRLRDDLRRAVEWDLVMRYDPLRGMYDVVRVANDEPTSLGPFAQHADAVAEVNRPVRPGLVAERNGRAQYYHVTLELEMLSVSDLDELRRWVRGDLSPTVRGRRNPGTAFSRGARTLLSRLLGGERWTLDARSPQFRVR